MAEALISLLVEQLGSAVYHHTNQGVKLVLNAEKDVKKFSRTLKLIQNVLQDAEKKQVSDDDVRDWLDQLKDVSYKMNDVLDAWNTEIGKRQAEKHESQTSDEGEVRFSFPSYCICLPHLREVTRRYEIGSTIKDLNEDLTQIFNDKNKYSFQSTTPTGVTVEQQPNPRPITSSFVDISTIFGRQDEKDGLVSELVRGESRRSDQLVIPIVGMGGLGKTTFAQLIFEDAEVQAHFDKKAWVCVSDPFDVIKIAKEILELVEEEKTQDCSIVSLQKLLKSIQAHIKDKKFLLVLDDVWTEDPISGTI
ncbi:hypothetical protein M0R45_027053 [Rubus argutus]|uniref:P-loop containing nucleoside triphosphate hydrolase n=1 Tax=Rubus argutus TaxID=59490 RepID=A0AAW1X130_RUBAR